MQPRITTQRQLRAEFWQTFPNLSRRKWLGDYTTDTRVCFVDWIDTLCRNGDISEDLAQRATL
jgi:hypothetical protein